MTIAEHKNETCFVLFPGYAPDNEPVLEIKKQFEELGYHAIATNFWGETQFDDFADLTAQRCIDGVAEVIEEAAKKYTYVIGIGISLGGAFLIEHAKNHSNLFAIVSIGTPFKIKNQRLIGVGFAIYPLLSFMHKYLQRFKRLRVLPVRCAKMVVSYLQGQFLRGFDKVRTPILFLHSITDQITDYTAVEKYAAQFNNDKKEIIYVSDTNHVIEYDGALMLNRIEDFFENTGMKREMGSARRAEPVAERR